MWKLLTKLAKPKPMSIEPSNASVPSPERQQYDHLTAQAPTKKVIPLILTYNPTNSHLKNILTKSFELLKSNPETMEIFRSSRVLGTYRRDSNLKDSFVHSNLQSSINTGDDSNGTFPCRRPRCKTCAYINSAAQINTPGGPLTI